MTESRDPLAHAKQPYPDEVKAAAPPAPKPPEEEPAQAAPRRTKARVQEEAAVRAATEAAPPPKGPQLYEVVEAKTVSWGSGQLRLTVGRRLSDSTHGPGAIARLIKGGVVLKPVDP